MTPFTHFSRITILPLLVDSEISNIYEIKLLNNFEKLDYSSNRKKKRKEENVH